MSAQQISRQCRLGMVASALLFAAGLWSCSPVDVNAIEWSCTADADCGKGYSCFSGSCIANQAAEQAGVTADEIHIALIAPQSGTNTLGVALKAGFEAGFAKVNAEGGLSGRQLVLDTLDDEYAPEKAKTQADATVKSRGALVVVGGVGEGSALEIAKVLNTGRVPHISLARSENVRPADGRYVFAPWGGYFFEFNRIVLYLEGLEEEYPGRNYAIFTQAQGEDLDAHGKMVKASLSDQVGRIVASFSYSLDTGDEQPAVRDTLMWMANDIELEMDGSARTAIILAGEAEPSARYARALLAALFSVRRGDSNGAEFGLSAQDVTRLGSVAAPLFVRPSGMGTTSVLEYLKEEGDLVVDDQGGRRPFCQDLLLSHPLPLAAGPTEAAVRFREELGDDVSVSEAAFEGWLIGQMIIETLRDQASDLSVETFVDVLERKRFDLGIEFRLQFEPNFRTATDQVYLHRTTSKCELEPVEINFDTGDPF